jgi:hypothetical protein
MKYVILKSDNFFTYEDMAKQKWRDLTSEAMKTFNVFYDLENDSSTKQRRDIVIPQKEWEFSKCRFKCDMFSAGGDWQYPVRYFRCQLVDGYAFGVNKYKDSGMFIYIPGKTEGNYHLVRGSKEKWSAPDNTTYKKGIDPEPNDRKCWESLKVYLKELVDKEIEKNRNDNS